MSAASPSSAPALERFHYDAMDRVVAALSPGQAGPQRFYKDALLASSLSGGQPRSIVRMAEHLLGVRDAANAGSTTLLATEQQGSVLRMALPGVTSTLAYTPYGEGADPLLLGFNGQQAEPGTGYYLLGNGYRAYNPRLMRFNSPDSFSPFEGAGLNPYTYCLGDPINRSDPTGHMSMGAWIGVAAGIVAVGIGAVIIAVALGPVLAGSAAAGAGALAPPAITIGGIAAIAAGTLTIGSGVAGIASAGLREKDPDSEFATNMGWVSTGLALSAAAVGGTAALSKAYDKALVSAFQAYAKTAGQRVASGLSTLSAEELAVVSYRAPSLGTQLLQPLEQLARNAASLVTQLQNPRVVTAAHHFAKAMARNLRPRLPTFGKPTGKNFSPGWPAPSAAPASSTPGVSAKGPGIRSFPSAFGGGGFP